MPGRGSRSIKPDPSQPILKPLNTKSRRLSTERPNHKGIPTETKRKRRSTGDKRVAKRSKELEQKKTGMPPTTEKDQSQDPPNKMSSTCETTDSSNNDTIQEIRNMEARLKGNNKSELEELETNLTTSMKKLLDKSMENALKKLNTNIAQEIHKHPTIQQHTTELTQLRAENIKLNQQLTRLDSEFAKLQSKISDMEQ